MRGRLRLRFGVEALDVSCRAAGQLLDLSLAEADAGRALDRGPRLLVTAPGALDRGELAQAVGVDLLWQVELGVFQMEVLPLLGALGEAADRDLAEDRLERAHMSGLDYAMKLASSVAYLIGTRLAGGAQVEPGKPHGEVLAMKRQALFRAAPLRTTRAPFGARSSPVIYAVFAAAVSPSWITSWQGWQTTRVLRRFLSMSAAHGGWPVCVSRLARLRTW